ncbi:MAG: PepSY domain-containing protein [Spongiibacteraceae bacterium]
MKNFTPIFAAFTLCASATVHAAATCPDVPEDKWMHVLDMQKKIVNEYGFAIKKFQTDGHCYEIYGWGKSADGKKFEKIEVYFNPVTGEIVKKTVED